MSHFGWHKFSGLFCALLICLLCSPTRCSDVRMDPPFFIRKNFIDRMTGWFPIVEYTFIQCHFSYYFNTTLPNEHHISSLELERSLIHCILLLTFLNLINKYHPDIYMANMIYCTEFSEPYLNQMP